MIPLIISCIALVISIIALIVALRKKRDQLRLIVNDDLSGLSGFTVKAKGVDLEKQKNCNHLFNEFIGMGQCICSKCGLNEDNYEYCKKSLDEY